MPNFFRGTRYAIRQSHHKFSPTDLAGLLLWLDPNSGLYQETGSQTTLAAANADPVGSWVARFGPIFAAIADAKRPTKQTVAGKIRLLFDGSDDWLKSDDTALVGAFSGTNGPYTLASSFQYASLAAQAVIWSLSSQANAVVFNILNNTTTPNYTRNRRNDANQANSVNDGTPDTSSHVSISTFDGSNWIHYVDGVQVGSSLSITSGVCTFTRFGLGILSRGGGSGDTSPFNGYIGPLVAYNRCLTGQEIAKLNTFLQAN